MSEQVIHGFKLLKQSYIKEIDSDCFEYKHLQSGAHLMYLKNEDTNKVFSASFKTPPTNNTGVPHIVEHCVLSGSRKYHTKEPFMDMVKGSMNTFINAMTFADKTMYPVASKNNQDFMNLLDVYLDAVFFPKIYEDETIFMQEGWRYDLHEAKEPIQYKGIVYNEMKGAFSDPIRVFYNVIDKKLFEGTCYSFDAGGHPDHITDLSYEDFLSFHKEHYHPSNSYLYLYGDLDLEAVLEHIDSSYLNQFDHHHIALEIDTLKPLDHPIETHGHYAVSDDESLENKDYLGLSFIIGKATDPKLHLLVSVLKEMLIESSASPLKKALLEANIAEDIKGGYSDGLYKKFEVILKNTDISHKEQFVKIVFDTLRSLCEKGIDKELIMSSINLVEYSLREAEGFPTKGIIYHINSMESWLYTDDATALLNYSAALQTLKDGIDHQLFENFILDNIVNSKGYVLSAMTPQKGLLKENASRDEIKLSEIKSQMSDDALQALIEKNSFLKNKQLMPDSKEALATIPKLSKDDIQRTGEKFEPIVNKIDDVTMLHHSIFTNGIGYIDFVFDMSYLTKDELPYASLLHDLLSEVSTEKYAYDDLSNQIFGHTGGIDFSLSVLKNYHQPEKYMIKSFCRTKVTADHFEEAVRLSEQIMKHSQFHDVKRIKELVNAIKAKGQSALVQSGNQFVASRLAAYLSAPDAANEILSGLAYYQFICESAELLNHSPEQVVDALNAVYQKMFKKNDLIIAFTGDDGDHKKFQEQVKPFIDTLEFETIEALPKDIVPYGCLNEGIKSSSHVQYVGKAFNFRASGHKNEGRLLVLTTILNSEYLHDRVRAKGGAYGCSARYDYSGMFSMVSYRDPNLVDTYRVFEETKTYIEELDLSEQEVEKFVIGAMSLFDGAKTPKQKGQMATVNYIIGRSYDDSEKIRHEIIDTNVADIKSLTRFLADFNRHEAICTLGNSDLLAENQELFKTFITI